MDEIWELVDKDKRNTGVLWPRSKRRDIPRGLYQVAVDVWVVGPDGKILLTQRHPGKTFPLMWEGSGGSVLAGETSAQGAARELAEETGIQAADTDMILLHTEWHSTYIMDTYLVRLGSFPALHLQDGEVVDAQWLTRTEMESRAEQIVPPVWRRYQLLKDKIWG